MTPPIPPHGDGPNGAPDPRSPAGPRQASAPVSPTIDSDAPGRQTRASDLEASEARSALHTAAVPADRVAASGRYLLTGFHARGGMGEVWRCRDEAIGREVALKRLVSDRASARERFLCEAQVTGQLEHPGIVPVHDLGFDDRGRPFYVMTLVRGRTLKAAIDEFFAGGGNGEASSRSRDVQRVALLKVFLDLCNAVAYAHSRGVIHRDLKPENVMLGAYGETVVLDWGLAKLRGQAELCGTDGGNGSGVGGSFGGGGGSGASGSQQPPPVQSTPSVSGQSAQTEDGSILGSPLYMPPEMAEGHTADADQRTDVYLLGATLYEILTGRPPREGTSRDAILEMARTAPPVPPRKLTPDVPRALEAVCLKAMSRGRAQRYESALALAEDVQRYLAGEPVSACRERLAERAWRWVKRHRRLLARTAAVLAVVVCAVAALAFYGEAKRGAAREQARVDLRRVLQLADEARYYAAGVDAPGELAPYYDDTRAASAASTSLAEAKRWGPGLADLPLGDAERETARRELAEVALIVAQLNLRSRVQHAPDTPGLLDTADALAGKATRASHLLRAEWFRANGRPDEAAAHERLAAAADGSRSGHDLFLDGERARLESPGAGVDAAAVDAADARRGRAPALERAVESYRAAMRADPADYWSRLQLGRCYLALGRAAEAAEALDACAGVRPDAPWAYASRGLALALLRRFDEATLDFDRALQLDPDCLPARLNRAVAHRLNARPADAAAELDALLARPQPPVEAALYRAQLFLAGGDAEGALRCLSRVAAGVPFAASLRVQSHLTLGRTGEAMRELDTHIPAHEAGARARRGRLLRHVAAQPPRALQRPALELAAAELAAAAAEPAPSAGVFTDLGAVQHLQGRSGPAVDALTKAIAGAPADPQPLINRGWAHEARDRLDEAARDFAAALGLRPDSPEALTGLAYVRARQGDPADAQRNAALALLHGSGDYLILHNVACVYAQLSLADPARETQHQDAAVRLLERAVATWRRTWSGPDELELIRLEAAFPSSMRNRADFQRLLAEVDPARPKAGEAGAGDSARRSSLSSDGIPTGGRVPSMWKQVTRKS